MNAKPVSNITAPANTASTGESSIANTPVARTISNMRIKSRVPGFQTAVARV